MPIKIVKISFVFYLNEMKNKRKKRRLNTLLKLIIASMLEASDK